VDAGPERIHAASRTRVTGLIMDAMLLQSAGRAAEGAASGIIRQ
jgi:hypothetical protein